MFLVKSVRFQVNFNGNLMDFLSPQRGLRHGDLISPYLLILIAEGLSSLLPQAQSMGIIHGSKVCRSALPISHLLFADDNFFFFRATTKEAHQ